jgi:hypothetical protein
MTDDVCAHACAGHESLLARLLSCLRRHADSTHSAYLIGATGLVFRPHAQRIVGSFS